MGKIYNTKTEFKDNQIEGLGDLLAAGIKFTGAEKIYNTITNKKEGECKSCEETKAAMNNSKLSKMFYGKNKDNGSV